MGLYEEDEPSSFRKYRVLIGCVVVAALVIAVTLGQRLLKQSSRSHQQQDFIMVNMPPPPAPPPPPTPSQTRPPSESDEKMIEQVPVDEMETKPDTTAKEPAASDAGAVGTSIQGNGSGDGFGLRGGNSTFGGGTGKNVGHGGGNRWGWYAGEVQSSVSQALESNNSTRTADFRVVVQIWSDRSGRITRARIKGSTGNAALDNAITNEVLVGHILQEPPPDGMPMPIVLRLTARPSQAALSR